MFPAEVGVTDSSDPGCKLTQSSSTGKYAANDPHLGDASRLTGLWKRASGVGVGTFLLGVTKLFCTVGSAGL